MNLPTFDECANKVKDGTASNLEKFIFNWEPRDGSSLFRDQLQFLLSSRETAVEIVSEIQLKDCHNQPPYSAKDLNTRGREWPVNQRFRACGEIVNKLDKMYGWHTDHLNQFWNPETGEYEAR